MMIQDGLVRYFKKCEQSKYPHQNYSPRLPPIFKILGWFVPGWVVLFHQTTRNSSIFKRCTLFCYVISQKLDLFICCYSSDTFVGLQLRQNQNIFLQIRFYKILFETFNSKSDNVFKFYTHPFSHVVAGVEWSTK